MHGWRSYTCTAAAQSTAHITSHNFKWHAHPLSSSPPLSVPLNSQKFFNYMACKRGGVSRAPSGHQVPCDWSNARAAWRSKSAILHQLCVASMQHSVPRVLYWYLPDMCTPDGVPRVPFCYKHSRIYSSLLVSNLSVSPHMALLERPKWPMFHHIQVGRADDPIVTCTFGLVLPRTHVWSMVDESSMFQFAKQWTDNLSYLKLILFCLPHLAPSYSMALKERHLVVDWMVHRRL